ncbi:hypothetical protein Patl1_01537 [Pistacia atlantica]|uniref:Uncharacterized protein n=1 Tax=Pistacia atlantica TaxID=434234 RepID=A0ACC1CAX7_9ROSI|nr:hypothetical protein Patl1_01537 [Pistacia atlantica]
MASDSTEVILHAAMFPYFAFGHISPFVQLSNKLSLHGVKVSFFSSPGNISRIKSTPKLSPNAQIIPLTIPHIEGAYIMVPERRNNHTIDDLMKPPKGFPVTSITSLRKFEAQDLRYVFVNFDGNPCVYDRVLDGHYRCDVIVMKTCNEWKVLT